MKNKYYRLLPAFVAAGLMFAFPAYAGITWTEQEDGAYITTDADGNLVKDQWLYEDDTDTWYYVDGKGERATGRLDLYGESYFLDENGKMLTGWIQYQWGETPDRSDGSEVDENTCYCYDDGRMARNVWVSAHKPEHTEYDDGEVFQAIQDDEYFTEAYYFDEHGRIVLNRRKSVDGKRYIFKEDGTRMTGWIYDRGEGEADRYLAVDTDSDEALKALCKEHPENMMFGKYDTGALTVNGWIDAIPPWDNEGDDSRSFYADSSGYIVTANGLFRGDGVNFRARRKARKIETIGTYQFEDWDTDVNVVGIDGKYYCLEDSGTRMDGFLYLSGDNGESRFPNGLYSFRDNAAMQTGEVLIENVSDDDGSDGYHYYYYFSDKERDKGRGICGVKNGRLYYHGLAVGAQYDTYEPVYLPTIEEESRTEQGTGMFLVDTSGRVKRGSKNGTTYTSDGNTYKVFEVGSDSEDYGYRIDYYDGKDEDNHKVWITMEQDDCDYICWDEVEE